MCLAIPGQIKEISSRSVVVSYPNEERQALLGDEKVKIGDFVLVQMGIVIKILSAKEAQVAQKAWGKSYA